MHQFAEVSRNEFKTTERIKEFLLSKGVKSESI